MEVRRVYSAFPIRIAFNSFSHRGTGKAHDKDAQVLDGHVHQGRVREHRDVDKSQLRYFAVVVLAIQNLLCLLDGLMGSCCNRKRRSQQIGHDDPSRTPK